VDRINCLCIFSCDAKERTITFKQILLLTNERMIGYKLSLVQSYLSRFYLYSKILAVDDDKISIIIFITCISDVALCILENIRIPCRRLTNTRY